MKKVFYMLSILAFMLIVMQSSQPRPLTAAEIVAAVASASEGPDSKITLNAESPGAKSIAAAAKDGRMLFMYLHDGADMAADEQAVGFKTLMEKEAASASYVFIDRKDETEKALIAHYQVESLPLPLILVLAPNGAITAGFPANMATAVTISQAFVSETEQEVLAALQKGRLILLCIQNDSSAKREEAMAGINEFIKEPQIGSLTEIITVDPAEPSESAFFEKLKVKADIGEAQTVMMIPPGTIAEVFKGAVSLPDLMRALQAATQSGCGCGH